MGAHHFISTGVRRVTCGCGTRVLVALAEGVPVSVDTPRVDAQTELAALMAGGWSYDLVTIAGRTELVWRCPTRMWRREHPVLLGHGCGRPVTVEDPGDAWKKTKGRGAIVERSPTRVKPDTPALF